MIPRFYDRGINVAEGGLIIDSLLSWKDTPNTVLFLTFGFTALTMMTLKPLKASLGTAIMRQLFFLTLFWKIYEPVFPWNCISSLLPPTYKARRGEVMNRTQVTSLIAVNFRPPPQPRSHPESNAGKQKYDAIRLSRIFLLLKGMHGHKKQNIT